MTPRVWYILGGAVMGALLGAVYANYAYTAANRPEPDMFIEVVPYDEVQSETVPETVTDQEVTTESESGNSGNP